MHAPLDPFTARLRVVAIGRRSLSGDPVAVAAELLAGGATAYMLREKDLAPDLLYTLGLPIARLCRAHDAAFIVNGRPDVALRLGADAVHLGHDAPPPAAVRAQVGTGLRIGVSAHAGDDLAALRAAGVAYATYSPVFATRSKPQVGPTVGLDGLRRAAAAGLPLVALGGIDVAVAPGCIAAGAVGVAAIGALAGAARPRLAARAMLEAVTGRTC